MIEEVETRDGKAIELSKNEQNQNPGFAKNRTEPEHESKECARTRTEPHKEPNRTETEPKCNGCYSVLSLNETVGTFTHSQ